ncbi:MFS transporter [Rothia sp. HMSC064D08]|uniref:MFS transporter n=1 Tax=Rothia sp. HMSC064D08 TaxID=1715104 RepID=UPI000A94DEC5|nr:MFS transporter [Rothia sp. HMSC064D08]
MSTTYTARRIVWSSKSLIPMALAMIAAGFDFYVPVSAFFLESRGLSLTDIFMLESVLVASILVAEIPAGIIGDRFDRRRLVCAGFVFNAIAEILFAAGTNFSIYALSFVMSGLSIAMLTGVQDAYIYDSLGDDADAKAVGAWGHLSALMLTAGVTGSVVGSALGSVDISLPALLSAAMAVVAAVCVAFLPQQNPKTHDKHPETSWISLKIGVKLLFTSPLLLYVAVGSSASFALFNAVYTLNQPLFAAQDVPIAIWGVIAGAGQLLAAGYNYAAGRIEKRVGRKTALLLAMGYGAAGFCLMAVPHVLAVVSGFLLVVVGIHARGPITSAVTNKLIPAHRRATVLNVASSVGSLVGIVVNPLVGLGAETSTRLTVLAIGGVLLALTLTWIPIANRYLGADEDADTSEAHVS